MLETLTARELRGPALDEDALGHERACRAFVRTVLRLPPGGIVCIQGAPGSGKEEFLLRVMSQVEEDREGLGPDVSDLVQPHCVWFNAWAYAKHGNPLAGLIAAVARGPGEPGRSGVEGTGTTPRGASTPAMQRAAELMGNIIRLRFDGQPPDAIGASPMSGESDPVDRVRRGFVALVDQTRQEMNGRLLVLIAELDQLSPHTRIAFLDGLRLLAGAGANIAFVVTLGREAALTAVHIREPAVSDTGAARWLDDVFDLTVNVPRVDPPRSGALLRRYLGTAEDLVRSAVGDNGLDALIDAASHPAMGTPRLIRRLAARTVMVAEVMVSAGLCRELTESQWAWIVLTERWPDFRLFVMRGGMTRWSELPNAVLGLPPHQDADSAAEIARWFDDDPLLAGYLRQYADSFERDTEGLLWVASLADAAGL